MILADRTIASMISDGEIGVEPIIRGEQIQPASLDLRLGRKLYDCSAGTEHHRAEGDEHRFRPGVPYIGHTVDRITLPDHIGAFLTGRSSVGRAGMIVHKTAGWIDPGFSGELTLELYNFAGEEETLEVGERVAQLVFFRTDRDTRGYDGQYQGQTGIQT